jgi:hypothetical protein
VRGHRFEVRLVFTMFFVACGMGTDDVLVGVGEVPDASTTGFQDVFLPPVHDVGTPDPIVTGGPLACGACTCDGTLYGCLMGAAPDGGCPKGGGGPPQPPAPMTGDAGDDANADAATSCGKGIVCSELPVECLPKPTCACITKVAGFQCTIDPTGNGFTLECPPSPP